MYEAKQQAVAIDIEDGANVATINNLASPYSATNASISAQIAGAYGSAIAIVDKSTTNSLTINNQGSIVAQVDVSPGTTPQDESPTAAYTGGLLQHQFGGDQEHRARRARSPSTRAPRPA